VTTRSYAYRSLVWLLGLIVSTALSGCADEGEELVVASPWPEGVRSTLATEFRRWAAATPGTASGPVRVRWLALQPGDDVSRVVRRRVPPDVVLGIPAVDIGRLARGGWLRAVERPGHPRWCVARRGPIVMARDPRGVSETDSAVAFDDPRHDPVVLAWARGVLAAGTWSEGYARLVRSAGNPRRIGRQPGAARAAFERGDVATVPWVEGPEGPPRRAVQRVAPVKPIDWLEGVAVIRGGRDPALAQEFVRFLARRGQAESPSASAPDQPSDLDAADLLADLLGATLVDAQDELWAAWEKLAAAGHPQRAERWMTEPPPWPPASIDKLLKQGEQGGTLLATWAAEIAPEADSRNWLLQSWLAGSRQVDGRLLAELAGVLDGRLAREPRFRAWLRVEWTVWARQRYRRVARLAAEAVP
jgi:hypothetical protein